MQVNVFVVGHNEGFVVAPCGLPLPGDEMDALGEVRFGWSVDSDHVVPKLDWMGIVKDIDARGYSIVPHGDVGGLLGLPQHELGAVYPARHIRYAA